MQRNFLKRETEIQALQKVADRIKLIPDVLRISILDESEKIEKILST